MAIPRVFVSSTCYDLKYIRENLKFFVRTLGYEPILSEEGDVFYNPKLHTHDSCINEIETCQIFVLIIGGRYGGLFKDSDKSITNQEYNNALKNKIPIFALVENGVYSDHNVYIKNKNNLDIKYPSADSIKIFEFIDEVRKNIINNAIVPFRDFSDIENYLKKQWAGMMHYYLVNESETKKVSDLLYEISSATQKIEYITKEIASSTIDKGRLLELELYEHIVGHETISILRKWGMKITPKSILENDTFKKITNNSIVISEDSGHVIYADFKLSKEANEDNSKKYSILRDELIEILQKNGKNLNEYLSE